MADEQTPTDPLACGTTREQVLDALRREGRVFVVAAESIEDEADGIVEVLRAVRPVPAPDDLR